MLPSLEEPLQLRDNLRLTPNTPSGLWPAPASGRKLMAANGCFGDAEPKGSRAAHLNGRFAACFVGDVVISAVTLAELEFGIACSSLAVQATNQSRRAAR